MADSNSVVTGDSREAVAYALLLGIGQHEGKIYGAYSTPLVKADADWVIKTYLRCWKAAGGEDA